jgi:hypothetical protein
MARRFRGLITALMLLGTPGFAEATRLAESRGGEIDKLKASVQTLQQTVEKQNQRIQELENMRPTCPSALTLAPQPPPQTAGEISPVTNRGAFNDQQEAAPRPDGLMLGPPPWRSSEWAVWQRTRCASATRRNP